MLWLVTTVRAAELNPDAERGVKPGLAYRVDGLDHVNLFNGTVNLTLPLGQSYSVGGKLSYSFQVSYATNTWEVGHNESDYGPYDEHAPDTSQYRFPGKHTNAGLGWVFTLGHLYRPPYESGRNGIFYVAPGGAEHEFEGSLHHNVASDGAMYTRDGTYLRKTFDAVSGKHRVEFPNGEIHTFADADGRLLRMEDRFGNWVSIDYERKASPHDPGSDRTVWTITDSVAGREHKVYFRKGWPYYEYVWEQFAEPTYRVPHEVVDKIVLATFDGTTAEYTFNYDASYRALAPGAPFDPALTTSRPCPPRHDVHTAPYVYIPILSSIDMPEGVRYEFVTNRGDHVTCTSIMNGSISGNVTSMSLPTGGAIEWTYQPYVFPVMSVANVAKPYSGISLRLSINAGIASRVEKHGTTILGRTEYVLGKVDPASTWSDLIRTVKNYDGTNLLVNATAHYFSGCRSRFQCSDGRFAGEYGRPFTRQLPGGGDGFLSTQIQSPDTNGALSTKRSRYVRYESDYGTAGAVEGVEANLRLAYERTLYEDGRYVEVKRTNYDGLGNYRRSETGGSFDRGNVRVTFTHYNRDAGRYELNPDGTLKPGFTMPSLVTPWILGTYDRAWTAENVVKADGTTAKQVADSSFCFDSKGFLTSRRTYANFSSFAGSTPGPDGTDVTATPHNTDLVAAFSRDDLGNLTIERYYGGTASAPSMTCGSTPPAGESYRIQHAYEHGSLARSWYVGADGNPLSFYSVDRVIDRNTGLMKTNRRFRGTAEGANDGTSTTFTYDALGRISDVVGGSLTSKYSYSLQPAIITSTDKDSAAVVLRSSTAEFDGVGRIIRESRAMPGQRTAEKKTSYNGLGWATAVTDWGASSPTLFEYDEIGRATRIQPPDVGRDDATTIQYTGISRTERTSRVWTGTGQAPSRFAAATTIEEHDGQGRLAAVIEPPPSAGASGPVTQYFYDVGNRLTEVCANVVAGSCGQKRTFAYDGRGFLNNEEHPEGGKVTYDQYDARGHLLRRYLPNGLADVRHVYDRAERLEQVNEYTGAALRPLKRFAFFGSNADWPVANGQLQQAVRYNWLDNGYTVQVAERYEYRNDSNANPDGRPTARITSDYACTLSPPGCNTLLQGTKLHEFRQTFTYDGLGNTTALGYPCLIPLNGSCLGPRTVTNVYEQGLLKSVSWSGTTNSIGYHDSGLVKTVAHENGVTDSIAVTAAVPSRPEAIVTTEIQVPGTCVAPSFTQQPLSRTVAAGTAVTLQALAVGEAGRPIDYIWYKGTAPDRSNQVGAGTSYTATATATTTTSYWVEAANGCGEAARSQTATVTVCTAPQIASSSQNKTITRGMSTRLTVNASGTAPLGFQWHVMAGGAESAMAAATTSSLTLEPRETTTYRVRITNACGSVTRDITVTVVAPPTVPGRVNATYDPAAGGVRISWSASSSEAGLEGYLVERHPRGDNGTFSVPKTETSYVDRSARLGQAYSYTVRALDKHAFYSAPSAPDFAPVIQFADDPIQAPPNPGTPIRSLHITQLREAVAALRVLAGLPAPVWAAASPVSGPVRASHFTEIQARLNEARAALGFSSVPVGAVPAVSAAIRGTTVQNLRDGVR